MKYFNIVFVCLFFALAGCSASTAPALTPLEIQSLQTREYEQGLDIVFPSVISVFQDLGYTVKSADKSTGFITAESAAKSDKASKFWLGITKVKQTAATAFIEEIGSMTKVRLNFVEMENSSSSWGRSDREDTPILDAQVYQNAFERIDNAIFVRTAN
ncbi:hypothetical protein INT08_11210 [Prosthecochloris sp. N3]|uniref:DUF4136 domain-containing protein n=1 Tax=Prosthecochloris ethylica TaxID=2743976 RepID=A0ABR9XUS1_9CHLB|nr:hypothetical protein [Prosthecochloris ethylica]MBF0587467.1 hypothetical protein [Prosthecochloris ethylica]MBF0637729.1 hypothetical protein [Prosthecochloris ethylica]NUK48613.1 hypothetical protein [Prosthecochloris ethylica]